MSSKIPNSKNFFDIKSSYFKDAIVSTAVTEAAKKSLENNFIWQKVKI